MLQHAQLQHQVSIAGRVINAQTQDAIVDAQVKIIAAPPALTIADCSIQTQTAADGHFHFVDLPNGNYTLVASLPNASRRYGTAQRTVSVFEPQDSQDFTIVDLALPPTSVRGMISDQNDRPIGLAEVQVKNSRESAVSNQEGQYLLVGLEAASNHVRTLVVYAKSYKQASQLVLLNQPGDSATVNFVLQKS